MPATQYLNSVTMPRRLRDNLPENTGTRYFMPGPTANTEEVSDYRAAVRRAFDFLRRADDRRYSSATKMRLLNIADGERQERPVLAIVEADYSFDELTEVKAGGVVAVYIRFDDGRVVVAVGQDHRRKGVASFLVSMESPHGRKFWVNNRNDTGMHFLLAAGLIPKLLNATGGVMFGLPYELDTEDGIEDDGSVDRYTGRSRRPLGIR